MPSNGPRLRVLVAHNAYQQRGGEDAVVEAEVSMLRGHGHAVELYQRHNDDLRGMGALAAGRDSLWSSRTGTDMAALIAGFKPDLVHSHNTFPLISPSLYAASAAAGIPVVQTLHNYRLLCLDATFQRDGRPCEDCLGKFPWRGVVHRCYHDSVAHSAALATIIGVHRALGTYRNKVSRYIALTQFSRAKFITGGLPADRISVKANFTDLPVPGPARPRAGALFVGRLSPEKGTAVLAQAAARRQNGGIDVLGEGSERPSLEGAPGIRLHGWRSRETVHARMCQASYLVVPSTALESFPVTVVEAFARALPVIASRSGGLAEIIHDGETGLLFEAGNAADLAHKMSWADANPEAMAGFGRAAEGEYQRKYTPERNYEALISIYQKALDSARNGDTDHDD